MANTNAALNDAMNRRNFMGTLINEFGLSERYADAAYLAQTGRDRSDLDMVQKARDYAQRYKIDPLALKKSKIAELLPTTVVYMNLRNRQLSCWSADVHNNGMAIALTVDSVQRMAKHEDDNFVAVAVQREGEQVEAADIQGLHAIDVIELNLYHYGVNQGLYSRLIHKGNSLVAGGERINARSMYPEFLEFAKSSGSQFVSEDDFSDLVSEIFDIEE